MSGEIDDIGRFRPNLKPIGLAIVANLIFGGGLLGVPYLRGQQRAEESAHAFARFSACLFDGEVAEGGGLALPRGERARFATLALSDDTWPERCRGALARVAREPATMLFPSIKGAELAVRDAVGRVDRALVALDRAAGARVPEAPLTEIARLQALVAAQVRGARVELDPMRPAIALGDADDLPTPSIVPLRVGEGGPFEVALEDGALLATAMDARVIGHARVDGEGAVEPRLARRRRLVSAVIGAREPPWVVWTTPASQCGEDRCAQRATGVAALTEDGQRLAARAWLRAHPIGAPRDAVHAEDDALFVAAVGAPGRLHLRRFPLPPRDLGEPLQLAATLDVEVDADADALRFVPGDPPALAWAGADAGLVRARAGAAPVPLESPGGQVTIARCGRADDGWIALASERGVRVARADGSGAAHASDAAIVPPERGAIRLACGARSLDVLVLREGELLHAACDADGCAAPRAIASDVDGFDAARFGGALLVAWSGGGPEGPVRITRVTAEGLETHVPAPCWAPADGLCGAPRLAVDASRAVIVTRQGGDLRVVASDDGRRWRALSGL